jgi:hypothetical protein
LLKYPIQAGVLYLPQSLCPSISDLLMSAIIQTQHSQETSRNFLFGMEHDCLSGMSSTTQSHFDVQASNYQFGLLLQDGIQGTMVFEKHGGPATPGELFDTIWKDAPSVLKECILKDAKVGKGSHARLVTCLRATLDTKGGTGSNLGGRRQTTSKGNGGTIHQRFRFEMRRLDLHGRRHSPCRASKQRLSGGGLRGSFTL